MSDRVEEKGDDFEKWEQEVEPVNVLAVVERAMDQYPWLFPGREDEDG